MAKAKYHKAQRVFVKPVGTWAYVEAVVSKWVKGCDEPIKIAYDCGMGREFAQEELEEESTGLPDRLRQRCQRRVARVARPESLEERRAMRSPPYPGTHPTVVTSDRDWGGWRVPGAEYNLDPYRIERQAQMIVRAPVFMKMVEEFVQYADCEAENLSDDLTKLALIGRRIISEISE